MRYHISLFLNIGSPPKKLNYQIGLRSVFVTSNGRAKLITPLAMAEALITKDKTLHNLH